LLIASFKHAEEHFHDNILAIKKIKIEKYRAALTDKTFKKFPPFVMPSRLFKTRRIIQKIYLDK
jgi:hypothetical protein